MVLCKITTGLGKSVLFFVSRQAEDHLDGHGRFLAPHAAVHPSFAPTAEEPFDLELLRVNAPRLLQSTDVLLVALDDFVVLDDLRVVALFLLHDGFPEGRGVVALGALLLASAVEHGRDQDQHEGAGHADEHVRQGSFVPRWGGLAQCSSPSAIAMTNRRLA